jgi:L-asparaginase / beta-aspartyl-peptidase
MLTRGLHNGEHYRLQPHPGLARNAFFIADLPPLSYAVMAFRILVHGGAGVIAHDNQDRTRLYQEALRAHVLAIAEFIVASSSTGITALDIVEFAVKRLEDDPLFNAGRGSVYTAEGTHELEASIMCGKTCQSGAASLITRTRNPISLARAVLQHPLHSYLAGEGAERLAREKGLEEVENNFFDNPLRLEQLHRAQALHRVTLDNAGDLHTKEKMGTVGCVCMYNGDVAAGTSTGGMTNKLCGRIGDSPIIGAGNYADNRTCAVSCTGIGEEFMKHVAAYDVSARMSYGSQSLSVALHGTIQEKMPQNSGGAIAVNADGAMAVEFNTIGMYRGGLSSDGDAWIGIWKEEEKFQWK